MTRTVFDPAIALKSLLDACPGSVVTACCKRCGMRIVGPVELCDRGHVNHPGECPPAPPRPGQQELGL